MKELKEGFKVIHEGLEKLEKTITDKLENKTSSRFVDNGDNTVTDTRTGLVWIKNHDIVEKKFSKRMTWNEAIEACKELDYAGHKDWRLPTREELLTIVDLTKYNPAIDPIFSVHTDDYYWTSTPLAGNSVYAWVVNFNYGYVNYYNEVIDFYVRAVRVSQ